MDMQYTEKQSNLSQTVSEFLKHLRALGIFIVVFAHLGGGWIFPPYSYSLFLFASIFFAASGAVNYHSFIRGGNVKKYLKKRSLGFFVPYFLFCVVILIVYIIQNRNIPSINFDSIILWMLIKPSPDITPFPIFQLWFLRTLIYVMLISPILFTFINKSKKWCYVYIIIVAFLAIMEVPEKSSTFVLWFGVDAYRILFYSVFFMIGAIYFFEIKLLKKKNLIISISVSSVLVLLIVYLTTDPVSHFSNIHLPNFCYASASFCSLMLFIAFRQVFVKVINRIGFLSFSFEILNKYSLGILLYHTLAIQIFENIFVDATMMTSPILYGLFKLFATFLLTFAIAIPTTIISNEIVKKMGI